MYKVTCEVRSAPASVLAGVLRLVKPYARLDARCLSEALIDYYLGLSFRASSAKRGFSHVSLWRYWHSLRALSGRFKAGAVAIEGAGFKYMGRRAFV